MLYGWVKELTFLPGFVGGFWLGLWGSFLLGLEGGF